MEIKRDMRVIAFVIVLFVACVAEDQSDSGYIFTAPHNIKLGSNNQLQMFANCKEGGSFKVKLFYSESWNGNETLAQEEQFNYGDGETLFNFFVNPIEGEHVNNGRLQMDGTLDGKEISGGGKVYFTNPEKYLIIIQTDKPMYKPGDIVKFRIIEVDHDLRPPGDENGIADVSVEDPNRTRLFQEKKVDIRKGVQQFEIILSDEPVMGYWKIEVKTKNFTVSITFEVKEYVLPKFYVKVELPPFVLANAKEFPVKICANYTYGKPVNGMLHLNVSLERYFYSRDKTPTLEETFKIDGCYSYTLNVSLIQLNRGNEYRRIMFVASVTEDGTGVQRNVTKYLQRQYLPLNLNFNTDQNYRQSFKPGLPYNGKLKVTNPDDTPASCEPIEICYTASRFRIIIDWLAKKKVKFCSNFTSNEDGYIAFIIPPQSTDVESIQLEAKSLKYARRSGDDILNQPSAFLSLSPYYSPSGSFIQMETIGSPIPCGTQKKIRLLFTSKENTEFELNYEVIRQGNVVQSGTKTVNFNIKDDVSKKFDNEDELINDSETQLVPPPQSKSSENDSDDENCKIAKEVKYMPPIGEVYIEVDVDADLSSSFTLLVFYVREDRETVADSQKIEVEKCFKNQVTFEFGNAVKQPGTKTSIKVTSSPKSLCGLKVVDKSVLLLNSNDQLTKEKIFQLRENIDNNGYYSSDPCNDKIPQPGLYSTKEAIIIRPPGPYISSSYEDALTAFQAAGFLVISNYLLFTRPCYSGGGFDSGFQTESFSSHGDEEYEDDIVGIKVHRYNKGHAVALASTARRPAAPQAAGLAADAKMGVSGGSETKSAVEVRDYFPETWLFNMELTDDDGLYVSKETLPHTITEWVGSAVCINSEDGLGLSDTATIKGFQAFFISYTMPNRVIRGEEITVVVSIFSYAPQALPITVTLDESEQFTVVSSSVNGDVCIQPDTSVSLSIKLRATTLGSVNITVRAETAASNDVCGSSTVYDKLAMDAITQSFECDPEGYPAEYVETILFCPTDEDDQSYEAVLNLNLPDDVVSDSARAIVDVTGNVLGPAIKNLNRLVSLPTGCGEQNMVKFTPNYLVLNYLTDIGEITDKIKSEAIRNLQTGYQRELTYLHDDGSFSAFGKIDKEGSMFLTAFVLRSFFAAQLYITIDPSVLVNAQKWIASKQQADGCFPNVGQIIDRGLQGGLEKEKNTGGITAYVVASLILSEYENKTVIENALACLSGYTDLYPYDAFLYAYAEVLAGNTTAAEDRIDNVESYANKTEGLEYYKNPNGTQSLNLETAAYAVLTKLKLGSSVSEVLPLVRYLTTNLNPQGGFYSTQDTCVGLGALSEYAGLVYQDPTDLQVALRDSLNKTIEITEDNKLLVQRNLVHDVPGKINLEAIGSGCGVIQAAIRYNTISPPDKHSYNLKVKGKCDTSDCKERHIKVNINYIPKGQTAGMSVLIIKMVTGTVPVKESLNKLVSDNSNNIVRCDVENNEVQIYFLEISNKLIEFVFSVLEVDEVDKPQPGLATVFDYYNTEKSASTSYSFGNSDISESSPDGDPDSSPEP